MLVAAWIALATLAGIDGAAASASYELHWRRAPGAEACVGARELADAVGARVGRPVFDGPGDAVGLIDGLVRPTDGGWHVTLAIVGPDGASRGTRELELDGADCRAIDESLTLVLALIVDPDAAWGPEPAVSRSAVRPAAPATPAPWRADAILTGAAARGVLPGTTIGARIVLGVDPPRMWPIALGMSWWSPELEDVAGGQSVELRRWQAGLSLCSPTVSVGPATVAGCGGGQVARVHARGMGWNANREARTTLGLAALTGRATVDVGGPVFAVLEVEGELALVRPRFLDDAEEVVYQVSPVSAFGAVGMGVRF